MPQYWLKPLGISDPPTPMPNDWLAEYPLDDFALRTGPATHRRPPQMGKGDRVLFHAVIHARVFAEGEILGNPEWRRDPVWGLRWPWVYPCRVDAWVPLIDQGPRTSEVAPRQAVGRIQLGGDFAKLAPGDHSKILSALGDRPTAQRR